jgi:hypothetical protein
MPIIQRPLFAPPPKRRVLLWVLLSALAAALGALAMRGYLSAEMLMNFSGIFTC